MLELGIELAAHDPDYDVLAAKFADHFLLIAHSMNRTGPAGMWDEEDRFPDGTATRLKVRSMVGLLPVCATTFFEAWQRERIPHLLALVDERLRLRKPDESLRGEQGDRNPPGAHLSA
jgi:hypothetical protein